MADFIKILTVRSKREHNQIKIFVLILTFCIVTLEIYLSCFIGPSHWAELYPNYCSGNQQSPVDIVKKEAVLDRDLGLFDHKLFGSDTLGGITLVNEGHECKL